MTKIDGEYLVTDEASVAVLFLGKNITENVGLLDVWRESEDEWGVTTRDTDGHEAALLEIRIPRALVREATEPVEGEPAVWGIESWDEPDGLVLLSADEAADLIFKDETKYNWRLVNICQDYDELRKLVEWARG